MLRATIHQSDLVTSANHDPSGIVESTRFASLSRPILPIPPRKKHHRRRWAFSPDSCTLFGHDQAKPGPQESPSTSIRSTVGHVRPPDMREQLGAEVEMDTGRDKEVERSRFAPQAASPTRDAWSSATPPRDVTTVPSPPAFDPIGLVSPHCGPDRDRDRRRGHFLPRLSRSRCRSPSPSNSRTCLRSSILPPDKPDDPGLSSLHDSRADAGNVDFPTGGDDDVMPDDASSPPPAAVGGSTAPDPVPEPAGRGATAVPPMYRSSIVSSTDKITAQVGLLLQARRRIANWVRIQSRTRDPSTAHGTDHEAHVRAWERLIQGINRVVDRLRSLRTKSKGAGGQSWHRAEGFMLDLPVAYFLHAQRLLCPSSPTPPHTDAPNRDGVRHLRILADLLAFADTQRARGTASQVPRAAARREAWIAAQFDIPDLHWLYDGSCSLWQL